MTFLMLNRYATQKAASTTADFNTKTFNSKISPIHNSKNQAGLCKKLYQIFPYQNIIWISLHIWSPPTWHMVQHLLLGASSLHMTENRCAVVSLHDMEKHSSTQYSMEVGSEIYTPGTLPLRSTPTMNGRGGWVSPRTSLGILENRKIFWPWQSLNPIPSSS